MSVPIFSTNGATPQDVRAAGGAPAWAWPAMLVTGVVWLAFCWTVLRVEPADIAGWAGAAVMLGATCEVVRAFAGGRMWAMNAGLAVLFAVTAAAILVDASGTLTTPAALIGWYLLVRGAVDVVVATGSRASDASWVLMVIVGVAQAGLGFWSSSSFARTADVVIVLVAALALARGLADLSAAYGMFAMTPSAARPAVQAARRASAGAPERPAGYGAGMADFSEATRSGRARHRAGGDEPATVTAGADRASEESAERVAMAAAVQATQAHSVRISPDAAATAAVPAVAIPER
jgi:hypothetical protein